MASWKQKSGAFTGPDPNFTLQMFQDSLAQDIFDYGGGGEAMESGAWWAVDHQ